MHPDQVDSVVAPDEHLSLTDQDVDILHQIITRAEEHPDVDRLPFRAIFTAYDDVLHEHGLDSRQDQVCFRFLFQLGSSSRFDGHGLYEKFLDLLERMGIKLQYDDDNVANDAAKTNDRRGGGSDDRNGGNVVRRSAAAVDRRHSQPRTPATGANRPVERPSIEKKKEPTSSPKNGEGKKKRRRRRRASFNSMYDATEELSQKGHHHPRPSSRSSVSRLETGTEIPDHWREANDHEERPPHRTNIQRRATIRNDGPRIAKYHLSQDLLHPDVAAEFDQYLSSADFGAKKPANDAHSDFEEASSSSTSDESEESDTHSIQRAQPPPEFVYRPSLSDLLRDASTFNMYRERNAARRLFRTWHDKTRSHHELFEHLYRSASNRDALTLEKQAFDLWHAKLLQKKQQEELERFFKHLEIRASRARDLYLLAQALTTWRGRASEESEKTKEARGHILAIKYFNAWKDITAVHELKIQRFTLRRPFQKWRAKLPQIHASEQEAAQVYNHHLARTMYWRWFWSFCDRRAPSYKNHGLKQKHIVLWIRALRRNREREAEAVSQDSYVLLHASFSAWRSKREVLYEAETTAAEKWKHKQLHDCLTEWNVKKRLGNAPFQLANAKKRRLLLSTFETWLSRALMQRQAVQVDRYRMLQSAWTAWNDKLRIQALAQRVDERIVMQVLYKWLLVGRQHMMQRIHEGRLVRDAYDKMFVKTKKTFNRLLNREEKWRLQSQRKLMRKKLGIWRSKVQGLKDRQVVAVKTFYEPRLRQDIITVWCERMDNIQALERMADKARFYFLMSQIIQKWREVTKEHSKQHRLEAYASIRRRYKMNLASKALTTWNGKTRELFEMQQAADDHYVDSLKNSSGVYLQHWYRVTSERAQNAQEADVHYNRKLVRMYLDRMFDLHILHRDQEEQSRQLLDTHRSRVAAAQVRKMSLRLFQIRASAETADRQKDRFIKKQAKAVFRQWLDKARSARDLRRSKTISISQNSLSGGSSSSRSRLFTDENAFPTTPVTIRPWSRISKFERVNTPTRFDLPERPHSSAVSRAHTPAAASAPVLGTPATPAYLAGSSARPRNRTKHLSTDLSTTPATPSMTPFAARLMTQITNGSTGGGGGGGGGGSGVASEARPQSSGKRILHRRGRGNPSLATVRFADDEDDDPEAGSPSKGRSTLRSSGQAEDGVGGNNSGKG